MTIDKKAKINKITRNDKILIATLDHGLTIGPINGIKNIDETINNAQKGGAQFEENFHIYQILCVKFHQNLIIFIFSTKTLFK